MKEFKWNYTKAVNEAVVNKGKEKRLQVWNENTEKCTEEKQAAYKLTVQNKTDKYNNHTCLKKRG